MSDTSVTASQPVPSTKPRPWLPSVRTLFLSALVVLIWPALMLFPYGSDASLDGSWPEVLLHAHLKGWQFGKDIIFTWGPWGFLNNQFHLGEAGATVRIIWETAGKLGISIALVTLTRRLPLIWQTLFLAACVYFNGVFLDTIFLVLITLIAVSALLRTDTRLWQHFLWAAVLAFLAQIKFTYTVLGCGAIVAGVLFLLLHQKRREAFGLGGGFVVSFAIWWVAAGQSLVNIPAFLRMSLEISSGYAWTMGVDEKWTVFWSCTALALACCSFVACVWIGAPSRPFAWSAALYLSGSWFVVWKHGMVRADGHELGFIIYTLLLAIPLPCLCFAGKRWQCLLLPGVCVAAGLVALEIAKPEQIAMSRYMVRDRYLDSFRRLWRLGELPADWQQQFDTLASQVALPKTREIVGSRSVDLVNYEQGVLLLNRFNYAPRPVFQSYSAYSQRLQQANLEHFRSPRAPDFVLWNHTSIDQRYPTIDDAMLVTELPRAYKLVSKEGAFLVLQKQGTVPAERAKLTPLVTRTLRLSEVLTLPPAPNTAVWFQARVPLSLLGRVRAFLYKPPVLRLVVTDEWGTETTWRLLPRLAEEGFLLSPLLESNKDIADYFQGRGYKWIRTIRLETPRKQRKFWGGSRALPEVQLSTIPGLALQNGADFSEFVSNGVSSLAPEGAHSSIPMSPVAAGDKKGVLFHPSASLVFAVPNNIRRMTGTFGISDDAWQGDGRSDGVDFVIEATAPDGSRTMLWRRFLDPMHVTGDRGPQTFSVDIPAAAGRRITLKSLPGPHDDPGWDWSYVGDLSFSADPVPP